MHRDQILLRLHGKLFRNEDNIVLFRMKDRLLYDMMIELIGFPRT